ncbi:MAG: outer membrane beta-barrel domain-containing protein [Bdellovibrionales bacterium]|nr:outer membrane beta-barrel domain-containing protein [Bdellovibrionales bacterium]
MNCIKGITSVRLIKIQKINYYYTCILVGTVFHFMGWETAFAQVETLSNNPSLSQSSLGQNSKSETDVEVEALYDKLDEDQKEKNQVVRKKEVQQSQKTKKINSLTDLVDLAPFTDVAVIQRKFLPHTGRFELSASGMVGLNNPFFNNFGGEARAAYYFHEKHGIEAQYMLFTNSQKTVTKNLEEKRDVLTSNLVTPKSYMGLAYKWAPVYGKITFLNVKIIPFDLFFTGGFGLTQTDKKQEPTFHLGSGQAFALSKSMAFRWDLVWNFYSAQVDATSGSGSTSSNHNDLFISLGVSFFVPEAGYR